MRELLVRRVLNDADMAAALVVRRRVFIEEQGVDETIEIDEHDRPQGAGALHVLALLEGEPVGTGRLLLEPDADGLPHIGRVAVLLEQRRRGVGKALMEALHGEARALGFRRVTLAAQLHAIGFYERLGYVAHGDVFLDAGIEHRQMDLKL